MVADRWAPRPVRSREQVHRGMVWDVVADVVDLGDSTVRREYVEHPGAVSVLAIDEQEQVLLLRQYRHPTRHELWELPAGLLDVADESPVAAAARELWEEVDLRAGRFDVLVDFLNSPGGSDEAQRVFLARDIEAVPTAERWERTDEEAGIVTTWLPLDEAVANVLAGHVHNPGAVIALLAADAARRTGWQTLRPADSPWSLHPGRRPVPRGQDAPST